MATCSKCNSQSTTFKEGISKKPPFRPWKGYKCDDCGDMVFLNAHKALQGSNASGEAPKTTIEQKIDRILAILEKNFGTVTVEKDTDSTPF